MAQMSRSYVRPLKWFLFLACAAVLVFFGLKAWKKSQVSQTDYKTASVTRGDITQVVTASGQLNPVVTVQVGSQISGIIQKLFADFNSTVTNGQVIAQLDPATFQANVHQAQGDLADAEAALELAQVNARRAKQLVSQNLLPQADYDKVNADLHQAEAQLQIKKAALEKAEVDLHRTTISSPINGTVISREVDVGQTVAASLNAPTLFKIANDLTKMQIDAMVSEADIGGVEVDQEVTFNVDAFPTRTFHGKVYQVRNSPVTTQNVVTYDTVVEVNNFDLKLKPGMTANVSIVVAHKENVLKLPNSALRFRLPEKEATRTTGTNGTMQGSGASTNGMVMTGEPRIRGGGEGRRGGSGRKESSPMKTVYAAEKTSTDDTSGVEPKPVQVKTGISDGVFTEIIEGLKEGDEVVVGVNLPEGEAKSPASNPFGGGFRRF